MEAMGDRGKDAVQRAADPSRLLPGEDPRSRDLDDAHHWLRVYDELYRFKADLITQTRMRLRQLPDAAQQELKDVDLTIMLRESERLASRIDFWKRRIESLSPAVSEG
jgi:hypothetical protein